ncbi:MAG: hypothetical protein IJX91_03255 [Clostridia bacterium]|nr:hypothetical protein [Clostridia bacterium]
MAIEIKGELCHQQLIKKHKPLLSYDETKNYAEWKKSIREKLIELAGINQIRENACPLNIQIESEEQKDGYKQIRFVFESEVGAFVPCYLLIPDTGKDKYPVAITLQGHSSGFHHSVSVAEGRRRRNFVSVAKTQNVFGLCRHYFLFLYQILLTNRKKYVII